MTQKKFLYDVTIENVFAAQGSIFKYAGMNVCMMYVYVHVMYICICIERE